MIVTQNRYRVRAGYTEENKEYVRRVMEELRSLHRSDLMYSVFIEDDGKTFVHWRICANEEARKVFDQLQSFQAFQTALAASHPEVPPGTATRLILIDATSELL